MSRFPASKKAFTLIEILTVIAIIGLLAGLLFGLGGAVATARNRSRATSEIKMIEVKLEEFKSRYGEYPMAESSSEEAWSKALFNALTGRWVYKKDENGVRSWDKRLESDSADNAKQRRPFISDRDIGTDDDMVDTNDRVETKSGVRFVDPWGHGYQYRYGTLVAGTGKPNRTWNNPGILLISAGAKYAEPYVSNQECFTGSMESTGEVPKEYFEDSTGNRNDNLTNFGPK